MNPTPSRKEMKVPKKLDIAREAIERQKKLIQDMPTGWTVSNQTYLVIEDKINEIIDYLTNQSIK